jgi:hypothetical protein
MLNLVREARNVAGVPMGIVERRPASGKSSPYWRPILCMPTLIIVFGSGFFLLASLFASALAGLALHQEKEKNLDQAVPAYHKEPAEAPLLPVMDPEQFKQPVVQNAYRLADKIKGVLYEQPCYCHCDRQHGHSSLLDCYTSKHTSGCGICLKELFYVYEQTIKGQTPEQIRSGIIKGAWKTIDASKYEKEWYEPERFSQ